MWILNTLMLITLLIMAGAIISLITPLINPYRSKNSHKKDGGKDERY